MGSRPFPRILAVFLVLPASIPNAAPQRRPPEASGAAGARATMPSGIRADRLSEQELSTWRSIRDTVFARDASGGFKHRALHALWKQVEDSGHIIYIEFRKPPFRWASAVGDFHIEKYSSAGGGHTAVIRLYPSVIDQVKANSRMREAVGFVPFLGLRKTECYAEVLGHELAHAVWILAHPDLAKLCEMPADADEKAAYCKGQGCRDHRAHMEMRERLIRLESLMGALEVRARATESMIWRELRAGHGAPR